MQVQNGQIYILNGRVLRAGEDMPEQKKVVKVEPKKVKKEEAENDIK